MIDAREFHAENLVIDGLNAAGPQKEWAVLARKANLDGMVATVGFMQGTLGTLREIEHLIARVEEAPDHLTLARSASSIEDAFKQRKTAVIMCSQNTRLIEDEAGLLDVFHAVGMRIIQLTYNEANLVGDGCLEKRNAGLSAFGRQVVGRMNRLGLTIDGSHTGKKTTMEAMAVTEAPFVFTHANARAICDSPRNIDDEQIEACARTGGVVGINAYTAFVTAGDPAAATLEDYLDHIDHVVRVAGVDHVGIGLDQLENQRFYAGAGVGVDPNQSEDRRTRLMPAEVYRAPTFVPGLESVTGLPLITEGLFRRGYAAEAVGKIIGSNWLRVYRETWGA